MNTPIDDVMSDLEAAIESFKDHPSEITLDDVYRATNAIQSVCKNQLKH
jgi:hypothetical protein